MRFKAEKTLTALNVLSIMNEESDLGFFMDEFYPDMMNGIY